MRIKNLSDIEKLGKFAQKQIRNAIIGDKQPLNKKETKATKQPIKKQKNPKRKILKTSEGLNYCPYPNPDPSVKLHIALLKAYGSFWNGGELVDEMILPGHNTKFRFDFCFPHYRLAIEVDGFGYHRDLNSFKSDRKKQRFALTKDWITLRLSVEDINKELNEVLDDIRLILSHRQKKAIHLEPVGKVWCKIKDPI